MIALTCDFAVPSSMASCLAIALLDWPSAMRRNTSFSRRVSDTPARLSAILWATTGHRHLAPLPTALTPSINSCKEPPRSMYP